MPFNKGQSGKRNLLQTHEINGNKLDLLNNIGGNPDVVAPARGAPGRLLTFQQKLLQCRHC